MVSFNGSIMVVSKINQTYKKSTILCPFYYRKKFLFFFLRKYFTFFITSFIINIVRLRKDLARKVYMRDILIEISKSGCLLVDAKTGGYIHAYVKLSTAERKAKEIAQGGKVTLRFINQ